MNWGVKIIVGLGAFMLFIICAAIYMVTSDSDSLVEEDYYEKSLSYDEVYERKQNLLDDNANPTVVVRNDTLFVQFISEQINGDLSLKRPSDKRMDKVYALHTTTDTFELPVHNLTKGRWTLEINWESEGKKYAVSQAVFL